MSRSRTGLLPEHQGLAAPVYNDLRLTIPAGEALVRAGHRVESTGAAVYLAAIYQVCRVTLSGRSMPDSLIVLCLIGHGSEQHRGLRLAIEPAYPDEWSASSGAIHWHERGEWLPCPTCGAPLVWYEAAYVPGYRVCTARQHHHSILAADGRSARPARG